MSVALVPVLLHRCSTTACATCETLDHNYPQAIMPAPRVYQHAQQLGVGQRHAQVNRKNVAWQPQLLQQLISLRHFRAHRCNAYSRFSQSGESVLAWPPLAAITHHQAMQANADVRRCWTMWRMSTRILTLSILCSNHSKCRRPPNHHMKRPSTRERACRQLIPPQHPIHPHHVLHLQTHQHHSA